MVQHPPRDGTPLKIVSEQEKDLPISVLSRSSLLRPTVDLSHLPFDSAVSQAMLRPDICTIVEKKPSRMIRFMKGAFYFAVKVAAAHTFGPAAPIVFAAGEMVLGRRQPIETAFSTAFSIFLGDVMGISAFFDPAYANHLSSVFPTPDQVIAIPTSKPTDMIYDLRNSMIGGNSTCESLLNWVGVQEKLNRLVIRLTVNESIDNWSQIIGSEVLRLAGQEVSTDTALSQNLSTVTRTGLASLERPAVPAYQVCLPQAPSMNQRSATHLSGLRNITVNLPDEIRQPSNLNPDTNVDFGRWYPPGAGDGKKSRLTPRETLLHDRNTL